MPYPEGNDRVEQIEELLATDSDELKLLAASFLIQGDEWSAKEGGSSELAATCYAKSSAFAGFAILAKMTEMGIPSNTDFFVEATDD